MLLVHAVFRSVSLETLVCAAWLGIGVHLNLNHMDTQCGEFTITLFAEVRSNDSFG